MILTMIVMLTRLLLCNFCAALPHKFDVLFYDDTHDANQRRQQELDHEFQLELSQARAAHDKALHAKVDQLLRSHARKLDVLQEERHLVRVVRAGSAYKRACVHLSVGVLGRARRCRPVFPVCASPPLHL